MTATNEDVTRSGWVPGFEAYAREVAARAQIPGMAISVARHGETVYEGGFGYRDAEQGLEATPDTVFGVGSVTKSFTALAVMQLADAGRLSVTDPVVKWLPEFRLRRPGYEGITVHHFLTHSGGLPPEPALLHARAASMQRDPDVERLAGMELPPDFASMKTISTYEELLELMAEIDFDLLGPPGRYFSYSNEGYALLQGIVERASGRSFISYLREHVWERLGMIRTGTQAEACEGSSNVTTLYARRRDAGTPAQGGDEDVVFASSAWHDIGRIYGNGGLASTVQDLIRYLEVYRNQGRAGGTQIVSARAVEQMTTPHVEIPTGGFYGYGLRVVPDYHGIKLVEHGGGNKGIAAQVCIAGDTTVAVLTNLTGAPAVRVALGAVNALAGLPLETRPQVFPEYECETGQLECYAGTYRGERSTARFYLEDGAMYREMQGRTMPARPYAEDAVVVGLGDAEMPVRFLRNEHGDVWAAAFGLRIYPKVE